MDEQAGSPISLLFMLVTMFLFVFLIGILPWRRRKKKKVSLSGQVKFASIWLFILSGLGFIGTATSFQLQGELSLMAVSIFVAAADQFATSLLIIKRSMHALMSLIGAMALSLFSFPFVWFNSYSGNVIFTRKNGHAVKLRCVTPSPAQIHMDSGILTVNAS